MTMHYSAKLLRMIFTHVTLQLWVQLQPDTGQCNQGQTFSLIIDNHRVANCHSPSVAGGQTPTAVGQYATKTACALFCAATGPCAGYMWYADTFECEVFTGFNN